MLNINEITAAAYRLLKADAALNEICAVYRGTKRPARIKNPALTVETLQMERRAGEGVWMGNIVVTWYVDVLADGVPDYILLEEISRRVSAVLADVTLEIPGYHVCPLIDGGTSEPEWDPAHEREICQDGTFGLVCANYK